MPTGFHADATGTVRLVEPTLTPSYLLDLAFQEISQLGASSWHVTRRLAAAYDDLASDSPPEWGPAISRLRESLTELAHAHTRGDDIAVQPDRLGLG
jgi:uncharacterized membrane protein